MPIVYKHGRDPLSTAVKSLSSFMVGRGQAKRENAVMEMRDSQVNRQIQSRLTGQMFQTMSNVALTQMRHDNQVKMADTSYTNAKNMLGAQEQSAYDRYDYKITGGYTPDQIAEYAAQNETSIPEAKQALIKRREQTEMNNALQSKGLRLGHTPSEQKQLEKWEQDKVNIQANAEGKYTPEQQKVARAEVDRKVASLPPHPVPIGKTTPKQLFESGDVFVPPGTSTAIQIDPKTGLIHETNMKPAAQATQFPKGQSIGESWTESGALMTRDSKGEKKVLVSAKDNMSIWDQALEMGQAEVGLDAEGKQKPVSSQRVREIRQELIGEVEKESGGPGSLWPVKPKGYAEGMAKPSPQKLRRETRGKDSTRMAMPKTQGGMLPYKDGKLDVDNLVISDGSNPQHRYIVSSPQDGKQYWTYWDGKDFIPIAPVEGNN